MSVANPWMSGSPADVMSQSAAPGFAFSSAIVVGLACTIGRLASRCMTVRTTAAAITRTPRTVNRLTEARGRSGCGVDVGAGSCTHPPYGPPPAVHAHRYRERRTSVLGGRPLADEVLALTQIAMHAPQGAW